MNQSVHGKAYIALVRLAFDIVLFSNVFSDLSCVFAAAVDDGYIGARLRKADGDGMTNTSVTCVYLP